MGTYTIGIDFGTKSTVVVKQENSVEIRPMRIGSLSLGVEVQEHVGNGQQHGESGKEEDDYLTVALHQSQLAHAGVGKPGSHTAGKPRERRQGLGKVERGLDHQHGPQERNGNCNKRNRADFLTQQQE